MPELPEVETVKEVLKKQLLNQKILDVIVNYPKMIEQINVDDFINKLKNQTIIDIKRRGKWLLFELNDYYLLSHLRMEGKYYIKNCNDEVTKHQHVIFKFKDFELRYNDTRKFGRMYLLDKKNIYNTKPLNELGYEPWDNKLNSEYLKTKYKNKRLPIKTVLLDQSIIVGIGNIYDDEILFLSHISPLKPACLLTDEELEAIIKNTVITLDKAIKEGGTTIHSFISEEGVTGLFQNHLYVHTKEGNPCPRCGTKIIKTKVNGRGTYYCPECQKQEEERVKI